jgi:hypothetical protein
VGISTKENFVNNVHNFLKENPDLFPGKSFIISKNEKATHKNKFVFKPDGSIGVDGVEVTTPIMSVSEFMRFLPKMFKAINSSAKTNNDCGLHISISLANVPDLEKAIDLTKLIVFLDEGYIYENFEMRRFNIFAQSAHHKLYREITKDPEAIKTYIGKKKDFSKSHHDAINIEHLSSDNKYVEFRYVGGAHYQTKLDRIQLIIARYIYSLSIACDPEYKRKEYLSKLNRIYNKIALFTIVLQLNTMVKEGKTKTREYHDMVESWKALNVYYKRFYTEIKGETQYNFLMLASSAGIKDISKLQWDFSSGV